MHRLKLALTARLAPHALLPRLEACVEAAGAFPTGGNWLGGQLLHLVVELERRDWPALLEALAADPALSVRGAPPPMPAGAPTDELTAQLSVQVVHDGPELQRVVPAVPG